MPPLWKAVWRLCLWLAGRGLSSVLRWAFWVEKRRPLYHAWGTICKALLFQGSGRETAHSKIPPLEETQKLQIRRRRSRCACASNTSRRWIRVRQKRCFCRVPTAQVLSHHGTVDFAFELPVPYIMCPRYPAFQCRGARTELKFEEFKTCLGQHGPTQTLLGGSQDSFMQLSEEDVRRLWTGDLC